MSKQRCVRPDSSMLPPARPLRDLKDGRVVDSLPDGLGSFLLALKRQGFRLVCRRNSGR